MIQADPRELTPVRRAAASTGEGTFCIERFRIAARDSAGAPKLFLGAVRTEEVTKIVVALPDRMNAYHPHAVLYVVTSDAVAQAAPLAEAIDELVGRRLVPPVITVLLDRLDEGALHELIPHIDRYFPTMPGRDTRALIGIGADGIETVALGVCLPDLFGNVQSWHGTADSNLLERVTASLERSASGSNQRLFLASGIAEGPAVAATTALARELHRRQRSFVLNQAGPTNGACPWSTLLPSALRSALRRAPWPA